MISEELKEKFIEYMLDNRQVERKVEYLGKHPKSRNGVFNLIKELADCDAIEKE